MITALRSYEQKYRDASILYPEYLKEQWLHGFLNCLESTTDPTVTLHIHSKVNPRDKPYRVMWVASTDRKVNGHWQATNVIRSRSFGSIDNAVKFLTGVC